MFTPPKLSQQPDTISLEGNSFMVISCHQQQQTVLRSLCKVRDIFARF
jgi:hypothetical protein